MTTPAIRRRRSGWWIGIVSFFILAVADGSGQSGAATGVRNAITEYEAKAGFLVLFGLYTEWPQERFSSATSPIIVGIFGEDPFNGALQKIAARQQGLPRPIEVRRVDTVVEAARCHMVFVSSVERAHEAEWFAGLADLPVLMVGETSESLECGAAIAFSVIDRRVRFEASWPALQRAKLKASSGMLASAVRVLGKEVAP